MSQEDQSPVSEPFAASADGKRNSYTLNCLATGQSMNYAACLWRQGVLEVRDIKHPADWAPCDKARCSGTCTALVMRKEEELAGKSIYFRARDFVSSAIDRARAWSMPRYGSKASVPVPAKRDMFDAMGDAGSLADAVTAIAAKPASRTPVILPAAQVGESPLQMARRLAQERNAA